MKFQEYLERRGSLNESNIASAQSTSVIGDIDLKIFELYLSFDEESGQDVFMNEEEFKLALEESELYEAGDASDKSKVGGEGNEKGLRGAKNPLAKFFRWLNTKDVKAYFTKLYKKSMTELAKITTAEITIEIKKDEMSGIKGPEASAKRKEFDALLEKIKIQREKAFEIRRQEVEKVTSGKAWMDYPFGHYTESVQKHLALLNVEEKLALTEFRIAQAKKILTDEKMGELKDQVKQLKARETKYGEELKSVEDAVKSSMEKDDFSDADNEVKAQAEELNKKIEDTDKDIDDYREKMKSTDNEASREDYAKNIESLMKNKESYKKEKEELKKKAKKVVLGSTSAEKES